MGGPGDERRWEQAQQVFSAAAKGDENGPSPKSPPDQPPALTLHFPPWEQIAQT